MIQSLAFTVGAPASVVARMDLFRKKRNLGGYERAGAASFQEAGEMIALAREISETVRRRLAAERPDLL